jgi:hypothetical protein
MVNILLSVDKAFAGHLEYTTLTVFVWPRAEHIQQKIEVAARDPD